MATQRLETWIRDASGLIRPGRSPRLFSGGGTPTPTGPYGPVSYASLDDLRNANPGLLPSTRTDRTGAIHTLNYIPWRWPVGTDIYTLQTQLGANDVPVMPEDSQRGTVSQISSSRTGTYLEGARLPAGLVGLGPNARIAFSPSFPSTPPTPGSAGAGHAMVGFWIEGSIIANFTVQGRYVGGLQYHAIKVHNYDGTKVWRVATKAHYGRDNHEPEETFGILMERSGQGNNAMCYVDWCDIDGRGVEGADAGLKMGSGGLHLVRGEAITIRNMRVRGVRGAAVALYARSGPTTIEDILIEEPGGNPFRPEPDYTERTPGGFVPGRGINVEVSPHQLTLLRPRILMRKNVTGVASGQHLFVTSTAETSGTDGVVWGEGGLATIDVIDPVTDVSMIIQSGAGGLYHGRSTLNNQPQITVTNARLEDGTISTPSRV